MSGLNLPAADGGTGDIMDEHGYPARRARRPTAERALVSGEYGGLGLAVPGHAWAGGGTGTRMEPDRGRADRPLRGDEPALAELKSCEGMTGAIYTQIANVEHKVDGFLTSTER